MADEIQPTPAPTPSADPVGDALRSAFGGRATQAETPAAATPEPSETTTPAPDDTRPAASDSDDDDPALPVETRFERSQRREAKALTAAEEAAKERATAARQAASYKGHMTTAQTALEALKQERDEFRKLATDADAREDRRWEEAIKVAPDEETRRQWQREFALDQRERASARKAKEEELAAERVRQVSDFTHTQRVSAAESDLRASVVPSLRAIVEGHAQSLSLPASELADLVRWVESPELELLAGTLPVSADPRQDRLTAYLEQTAQRLVGELDQRAAAFEEKRAAQNRKEAAKTYRPEVPVGAGGGGGGGPEKLDDITDADFLRILRRSG